MLRVEELEINVPGFQLGPLTVGRAPVKLKLSIAGGTDVRERLVALAWGFGT